MEVKISKAFLAYGSGEFRFKSQCTAHFKVLYRLFLARSNGVEKPHGGRNKALTNAQETALMTYLNKCIYFERYPNRRFIKYGADSVLGIGDGLRTTSPVCVFQFLKRYPFYRTHRSKPISAEQQAAEEKENIQDNFK